MDLCDYSYEPDGEGGIIHLRGALTVDYLDRLDRLEESLPGDGHLDIDLSGITDFDTAGAYFVRSLLRRGESAGRTFRIVGMDQAWSPLFDLVCSQDTDSPESEASTFWLLRLPGHLGLALEDAWRTAIRLLGFLGQVSVAFLQNLLRPSHWRLNSTVYHFESTVVNAVPIVSLIAFLIGVVIAYQGAVQLRQFGTEIYTVDFLAIAIFRELGILLTAIIVAGRTASAFTAQIGSMQANEEVSAMRTMGLDPIEMLVLPRVMALVLGLPLLAFLADILGLVGGAVICWVVLDIGPQIFIQRLPDTASMWSFWLGIIKAPFFGMIIGMVGCFEGMSSGASAESVGRHTTRSVVQSIFLVIVVDAAFSVLFSMLGI